MGDWAPERQRLKLNQWQGKNRTYHGVRLELPEIEGVVAQVALVAHLRKEKQPHHLRTVFWRPLEFELPSEAGSQWKWIDSASISRTTCCI